MRQRLIAVLIGFSVLAAGSLAVPGQAAAADPMCGQSPEVLVVMDRSGSMKDQINGQSKWSIAKGAVSNVTQKFGTQLALGLMLFPHWPAISTCAAGQVNVAPAVDSGSSINATMNTASPSGNTPMADTLDQALAHFAAKPNIPRYVILVTDGMETCLLPKEPLSSPGSCDWMQGTNYRKCGDCGWQFCLSNNTWSSVCSPKAEVFPCIAGQTCGSNALCTGTAYGSSSASQAASKLSMQGVKTFVVGFGQEADPTTLNAIASAGGTGKYHKAETPTQLVMALNDIAAGISCCGNGELDPGELCDKAIPAGLPGACPTSCSSADACSPAMLAGSECDVRCEVMPITKVQDGDGCCPPGATSLTDSDCPASCGNGVLEAGETCDPGITAGEQGACPTDCDDSDACTEDVLGGTACNPTCVHTPLGPDQTKSDGCCPAGNYSSLDDPDCPPPCSPDNTTDCVDLCATVVCPDEHSCQFGVCVPWDKRPAFDASTAGCDCRTAGGSSSRGGGAGLLAGLLLLAGFVTRRLRRR